MTAAEPCLICGADAPFLATYHAIEQENDLEVALFGGKRVHRCTRCGHAFCSEHLPVAMIANYYESFWNDRSSTGLAQRGAVLRHNVRSSLIWARDRLSGERGVRASEHLEFPPLASWLAGAHARNLRMLEIGAGPAEFWDQLCAAGRCRD